MTSIERVVQVQISRTAQQVPIPNFGVGLILAAFSAPSDRAKEYADMTEVTADHSANADVIQAATLYFSQSVKPTKLVIGRKSAGDADWLTALQAVQAANDSWYTLMMLNHTQADVEDVAAWIETQQKMFVTSSQEAGILTSGTTDIAYVLKALGYDRTSVLYNALADTKWPEAAWVGRMLPVDVGVGNWKFKNLTGVVADALTSAQIGYAQGKNANVYLSIGGVDVTLEGVCVSGEFMDAVRFIDWLIATMEVGVYTVLVNADKVPYTNKGVAMIENPVRETLQTGQDKQGLAPGWTVTTVDTNLVPSADRIARRYNSLSFAAQLAGAINKVTIQGYVTV